MRCVTKLQVILLLKHLFSLLNGGERICLEFCITCKIDFILLKHSSKRNYAETCRLIVGFFELTNALKQYTDRIYIYSGLGFQGGMAGFAPKIQGSRRKINRVGRRFPPCKILAFPENFCFCETKLPISEKIVAFRVTLDNFLVSEQISYRLSEMTIF